MRIALAALLLLAASATSAQPRVVKWSHAEASKKIYFGNCPVRLIFTGTILAARAGDITFGWKRSDGSMGPLRTIHAVRRGEGWRVHEEWEISSSTRGWAQLWIQSERQGSPVARFHVHCK